MLFHFFPSQDERRAFGGGDFIQLCPCNRNRGTPIEELVSPDAVSPLFWDTDSLYISGDDWEPFCAAYGEIIPGGTYQNLQSGYLDWCGINYFTPEQTAAILKRIEEEQPPEYQALLAWFKAYPPYNGFYVLGL